LQAGKAESPEAIQAVIDAAKGTASEPKADEEDDTQPDPAVGQLG